MEARSIEAGERIPGHRSRIKPPSFIDIVGKRTPWARG
jgi:hypothetical protein